MPPCSRSVCSSTPRSRLSQATPTGQGHAENPITSWREQTLEPTTAVRAVRSVLPPPIATPTRLPPGPLWCFSPLLDPSSQPTIRVSLSSGNEQRCFDFCTRRRVCSVELMRPQFRRAAYLTLSCIVEILRQKGAQGKARLWGGGSGMHETGHFGVPFVGARQAPTRATPHLFGSGLCIGIRWPASNTVQA